MRVYSVLRCLLTTAPIIAISLAGYGQDTTKKKTIDITSTFKPVLKEGSKINFNAAPPVADTSRPRLAYSIPSQNLLFTYVPTELKPVAVSVDSITAWNSSNYIKVGVGNVHLPYVKAGFSFGDGKNTLEQDAYIRSADCYYMNKEYSKALSMYNKVLEFSWPASDYATFQKGMIAGAGTSNNKEKITLMTSIARKYPTSPLIADANMELANYYMVNEQYQEAIPFLKNVVNDPNPALRPKAMLRLGIVYYNQDNNDAALEQYTSLLKQYPNSPEADAALENARSIYIEQGKTSEYVGFARSMGKSISGTQEDQLAYQEAEVQFNNGNFPAAARKFEDYLSKFPEGKFSLEALYYKSEIYFNQKAWAKAVSGYETLSDRVPHKFGEKSLLNAARLNFFDLKDYEKAEKYFGKLKDFSSNQENKLEAMRGLLRSQYQLSKWDEAVANAKDLLNQKGIGTDDKVLANMAIARSYKNNNQCELAITQYRTIISLSKSAYSAEARYEIAHCYYLQNKFSDAEKAAFEVINKAGSYEDWITKAYILLGDVYMKTKDYFNAKATYQSVVDNAKIETLRQEAVKKLAEATEEERKTSKLE